MRILEGKKRVVFDDGQRGGGSFELEAGASLIYIIKLFDGTKNIDLQIKLNGEGAKSRVLGIFRGAGRDKFRISVETVHKESKTCGETLIKGVLRDNSYCLFKGLVEIGKNASGSEDMLTEKTLALSSGVKAESFPFLEIKNQDVKVSHSVIVADIDKEQMFYLQSRGLERGRAEDLIIKGFLDEITAQVPQNISANIKYQNVK